MSAETTTAENLLYSLQYGLAVYEAVHGERPEKIALSREAIRRLMNFNAAGMQGFATVELTLCGLPIVETRESGIAIGFYKSVPIVDFTDHLRAKKFSLLPSQEED